MSHVVGVVIWNDRIIAQIISRCYKFYVSREAHAHIAINDPSKLPQLNFRNRKVLQNCLIRKLDLISRAFSNVELTKSWNLIDDKTN